MLPVSLTLLILGAASSAEVRDDVTTPRPLPIPLTSPPPSVPRVPLPPPGDPLNVQQEPPPARSKRSNDQDHNKTKESRPRTGPTILSLSAGAVVSGLGGGGGGSSAGGGGPLHAVVVRPEEPPPAPRPLPADHTPQPAPPDYNTVYEAVRGVYLAVDGRRLDAGNPWIPLRENTPLDVTCVAEGGSPRPSLSWRLEVNDPGLDPRHYLTVTHTNYSREGVSVSYCRVSVSRVLHDAALHCSATQPRSSPPPPAPHTPHTARLRIRVTYPPVFTISRVPGFGAQLVEGAAAELRCAVDAEPPARGTWQGGGGTAVGGGDTLSFPRLTAAHAGWYTCRARWNNTDYSSIGYYLNVIPMEEARTWSSVEPSAGAPLEEEVQVPLGGTVHLHCPKGSVGCWWRRSTTNLTEGWLPAGSHHAHGVLDIKNAIYQEAGEYKCIGARGGDLGAIQELKKVTLKVTGAVSARAVRAVRVGGGWRLEGEVCGAGSGGHYLYSSLPSPPTPLPQPAPPAACVPVFAVTADSGEVWLVVSSSRGAAVAVFPPRAPPPPPSRHAVRAPPSNAHATCRVNLLLLFFIASLVSAPVIR